MPSLKAIRKRISSVKSTQKITRAMKMVAGARLNRAQQRITELRPYAVKTQEVLWEITREAQQPGVEGGGRPEEASAEKPAHPLLVKRAEKRVLMLVLTSDRGLCGALNTNVFKTTLGLMKEWQGKGANVSLCLIGSKGLAFFRRLGLPILASVTGRDCRTAQATSCCSFRLGRSLPCGKSIMSASRWRGPN